MRKINAFLPIYSEKLFSRITLQPFDLNENCGKKFATWKSFKMN